MSTFLYELVPLPDSVRKCYGRSLGGAKGSMIVTGIIPKALSSVTEIDQLWKKSIFGDLTYSSDFQFRYYLLSRDHIVRKNPNFHNNPFVYASTEAFTQYQGPLSFSDFSFFFAKNQGFLTKIIPLLKAIVLELC